MIRRTVVALTVMAVVLLVGNQAARASGFLVYEQGVRATGMGGAVVASPFDPASAGFYNPAGLAFQRNNRYFGGPEDALGAHFAVGGQFILAQSEYDPDPPNEETFGERLEVIVPAMFSSIDLGSEFYLGISNTHQWGLEVRYPENWSGRHIITDGIISLDMWNVSVATRREVSPGIDLGLAFGLQVALDTEFSRVELQRKVDLSFFPGGNGDADSRFTGRLQRPNVGVVAGLLLNLREMGARVGLSWKSGVQDLIIEGRISVTGDPGILTDGADADTTADLPALLVLGVAKDVGDFTVEVNLQWTGWSSFGKLEITTDDATLGNIITEANWKDVWAGRIGVEYRGNADLTVRMGGVWDQDPVPGDTLSPQLPDEDRYVIAMGLSYDMGFAILDLSYQHVFFRLADKNNDVGDADSSLVNVADGDYRNDAHMFGLGVRADF